MDVPIAELKRHFADIAMVRPAVIDSSVPPVDALLLREIGVPREFAGWFEGVDTVNELTEANGVSFLVGKEKREISRGFVIGRHPLGHDLIDQKTGAIVFVNNKGEATFLNSSLLTLLYFISQFLRCAENQYCDVSHRRDACRLIDNMAFEDENGPWAVLFEEAEAGLFG